MADDGTQPTRDARRPKFTVADMLLEMSDATWRVFVPTVGLLLVGRYLDVRLHTKPFLMLLGVILGAVIAALLIKKQLARGK